MIHLANYINGALVPPTLGHYIDNYEPAKGVVYAKIPDSTSEDLEKAVEAATNAFPHWSALSIDARSRILLKLSDLIEENLEELAQCETQDAGKPIALSRTVDIPRASANFRFFASAIVNFSSEAHVMEGEAVNYTRRGPLGVVGCISPWNLPIYLLSWKIAPALAMGNCVIAKPSELTPYTAFKLSELAIKAGLPPGVLNILHGTGKSIGQPIVDHPKIKAISFTGGTATGRTIGASTSQTFKKVSLELGGKNPNLVFADCDFDEAVKTSVRSAFANQGEICLCGSRIFIERSIYDRFKTEYIARVNTMKVGDPFDDVHMGALISEGHMNKVLGFIAQAKTEGGTILTGGMQIEGRPGYFVAPTVIEGLDAYCSLNQQEVFGPVVSLIPFDTEQEAITWANSTEYGLAATIWTNDLKRAHRISHALQAGIVWVNCWLLRDLRTPFGGMKNSGVGREGGNEALRFFSEPQNICIKL
jgi:aminomuconate-semialdehyde/2-hydroxymuconate-6-semialdehyde dehydrogenase